MSNLPQRQSDPLIIFETLGGGRLFAAAHEGDPPGRLRQHRLLPAGGGHRRDRHLGAFPTFTRATTCCSTTARAGAILCSFLRSRCSPRLPRGLSAARAAHAHRLVRRDAAIGRLLRNRNPHQRQSAPATHGETVDEPATPVADLEQLPRLRMPLANSPLAYLDPPTSAAPAADFTARAARSISTLTVKIAGNVDPRSDAARKPARRSCVPRGGGRRRRCDAQQDNWSRRT